MLMTTMLFERDEEGTWNARWRDAFIQMRQVDHRVRCWGRSEEGEPQFEWTENGWAEAIGRMLDQEEAESLVMHDRVSGKTEVHEARLRRPVSPPVVAEGEVPFPGFVDACGVLAAVTPVAGHWSIPAADIQSVEYLRVGRWTGSLLSVRGEGAPRYCAVGVEPGAVLMRVYKVSPEDAKRLRAWVDGSKGARL